jgi:hypothetical protein
MKRGIGEARAWQSATNGRGPWYNSGASHMNQALAKKFFDQLGKLLNKWFLNIDLLRQISNFLKRVFFGSCYI